MDIRRVCLTMSRRLAVPGCNGTAGDDDDAVDDDNMTDDDVTDDDDDDDNYIVSTERIGCGP